MPKNKLTLAQVDWTNEGVPFSKQYQDIYFSVENGLAEVEHNFINGNNILQRFASLKQATSFRIAETGFGSGLNFLRAAEIWLEAASDNCELHFISFEMHPMSKADLVQAHGYLPKTRNSLQQLASELVDNYPLILPGWHDVYLANRRIRLSLWFGDVLQGMPDLDASPGAKVDAWFLDGFAPSKNPAMWQASLFQQMARLSHDQTTFATFTAAGEVRRGLEKVGFKVEKGPGFGRKRERCFGHLQQLRPHSLKAPWFSRPVPVVGENADAVVVGAGLAGAAVAYRLAKAGYKVTVLEAEDSVASLASGNQAGTLHPLVTADWNIRSRWYLQGFETTLDVLQPWLDENKAMGDLTGLLELEVDEKVRSRNQQAIARVGLPKEFVSPVSQQQASEILGCEVSTSAMFFPRGGWLYPKAVVEKCLDNESIQLYCGQKVSNIELMTENSDKSWLVKTQSTDYHAKIVVIATGSLDSELNTRLGLPIRPVKGQVTHLKQSDQACKLKKAVTHAGYSVSHSSGAVSGASFEAPDMSLEMSLSSQQENLKMAKDALPNWLNDSDKTEISGRVAFRPTTPDHLPIVGPVADPQWVEQAYLSQSHTHAVYRYPEQKYLPGLFISNGHGPRGLLSVFIAAESILADIQGISMPQPLSLYHASHPLRFTIRGWRNAKQDA